MNINIFANYRINIKHKWTYKVDYDEFSEAEGEISMTMNGSQLLEEFEKILKLDWLCSIDFNYKKYGNLVKIETFNPMTGESSEYYYEILEIERDEEDGEE